MSMTNTKKALARADIEADNGSETVCVPPECINLATDPSDELYCPGVEDEPAESLVESIANSGWADGSVIVCVNRGPKGGAPFLVAATGRSRRKAAIKANEIRVARGQDPVKAEIKILPTSSGAYELMLIENNKQDRGPMFKARRWEHHLRIAARKLGKTTLDAHEKTKAREEFAALTNCSTGAVRKWEALLAAHPDAIAALESRKVSANETHRIIETYSFDDQATAIAKLLAKTEPKEEEQAEKPAKEKKVRGPRLRHPAIIAKLQEEIEKDRADTMSTEPDRDSVEPVILVDALLMIKWFLGDDSAIQGHSTALTELRRLAVRAGWKAKAAK